MSRWLALAPLTFAFRCGPTPREAGTAALAGLPGIVLVAALLVALLETRRRARPPARALPWLGIGLAFGAACALAVLGFAASPRCDARWWRLVGLHTASCLTLVLVTWRVFALRRPAASAALATVAAPGLAAAVGLVLTSLGEGDAFPVAFGWLATGGYGAIPALLLAALLVEAESARRRERRDAGPDVPPD
ncbi:MAG: hypothetical protein HY908_11480 [Myxococcales bacterium]|nr:hypothetical protein [Myxococcales bacterium]